MIKSPKFDIGMILFANEHKLRSHAVKHLTNTIELDKVWKNVLPKSNRLFSDIISDLEALDCPFLKLKTVTPPCHRCHSFKECTNFISALESAYIEGINEIIFQTIDTPRYAIFHSNKLNKEMFSFLSDSRIILKAIQMEDDVFNLMTCYAKIGMSYIQILKNEKSKILFEAKNKTVQWCNSSKWRVDVNIEKKKVKKKKKPKNPYRRTGGGNWQQYINETEDW